MPKYFIIFNDWEGGGGIASEYYNTAAEAIQAVKNNWFGNATVIKGEIVYDPTNVSERLENASKN